MKTVALGDNSDQTILKQVYFDVYVGSEEIIFSNKLYSSRLNLQYSRTKIFVS